MRKPSLSFILCLVLVSFALEASAVPIPVENFSFELPGTTKQTNLARVRKMYIGLGDKTNPAQGGTGRLYLDDIGLTKPAPAIEP